MKKLFRSFVVGAAALVAGAFASDARAWVMTFEAADFGLNPTFSNVQTFAFTIDIADPMVAGGVYNNPTLNSVVYNVFGVLAPKRPQDSPTGLLASTFACRQTT